jgi:alpha-beta hydrolase superfamily lysophospholipase
MPDHQFTLPPASDGQIPVVHAWRAGRDARGVVIFAHGMGEHSLRYESLARAMTGEGFDVYAHDHRGHGKTAGDDARLGDYGPDGWRGLLDDLLRLIRRARQDHDGPILVMGHSMGSMLVQHLLTVASDLIDGAALSGTTAVDVMASTVRSSPASDVADGDLFSTFNAAFEPVRTESDWLSRDAEQVDLYVADPLCGFGVSDASLESLMTAGVAFSTSEATGRIRKDLPIYLFAGDADPVGGGGALVTLMADRYREAGIEEVQLKLYPEARHEVFNETNRQEVESDFKDWALAARERFLKRGAPS